MSFLGFGKKSDKELMKENDRALKKVGRDIERERQQLDREEKKLILDIKKAAKDGNNDVTKILAKQLVQLRNQKARTYTASSKVQAVGTTTKVMASNAKMAEIMGTTTKAMGQMNKVVNPAQLNRTLQEFSKESTRMEMTDEMINSTLDDIMTESGDEEESDEIVNQVLDEIGIEISSKLANAPTAKKGSVGLSLPDVPNGEDLEAKLARLKTQ